MPGTDANPAGERQRARDLNELIRYTMWSVFRLRSAAALEAGRPGREALAAELEGLLDQAAG
jgi:chlorite dismutase